jgi:hypothetical protein
MEVKYSPSLILDWINWNSRWPLHIKVTLISSKCASTHFDGTSLNLLYGFALTSRLAFVYMFPTIFYDI